ncbi:MAG: type II toxin-antitoxin system RelE/ParE family toxin [Rhizobiaceae bacterium]|jgi:mRNA interferase RelE/StbE|nr:type II toxin-antitoxin system RelE/ParE family toxin [Rhizobiaceae bacterium]
MGWAVVYHPKVQDDFRQIGRTKAVMIANVIRERLANGEPEKTGKALSGELSGYRRLRTGDMRIVYSVNRTEVEILVLAIGLRRDDEIYNLAMRRLR